MLIDGKIQESHDRWDVTRWAVWQLSLPHFKKGRAPKTPEAFFRFPWEATPEEEVLERAGDCRVTEEEREALDRLFGQDTKRQTQQQPTSDDYEDR